MRTAPTGLLILLLLALHGCAGIFGPARAPSGPLRLSDYLETGDPAFRASLRLVLDGLDEDAAARPDVARVLYERALQVDPTNPYAYLAIARHRIDGEDPAAGLPVLDKAQALFEVRDELSPGVEANLAGLRGAALLASGRRTEGMELLEQARALSPEVWADARLSPAELR